MDHVNELTVVSKLRDLAADPANQPYIVRRSILPTLQKFLADKDPLVALRAAETLRFLSSHPDNPEYMCREKGLVPAVVRLYQSTPDPALKAVAADIMKNLRSAIKPQGSAAPNGTAAATVPPSPLRPESGSAEAATSSPAVAAAVPVPLAPPPEPPVPEFAIVLEVWDNTLKCDDVEKAVVAMKGVLSCVAMPESRAVRVVSRVEGSSLVAQLKQQGMAVDVADQKPYVPADPSDAGTTKPLVAAGENSLAARLQRQREERMRERDAQKEQETNMGRFFKKISSLW